MDVSIDESRHDRLPGQVDANAAGRKRDLSSVADRGDFLTHDDERRALDGRARIADNQAGILEQRGPWPAAGCCARTTRKLAKAATAHVTDRDTSPILRAFMTTSCWKPPAHQRGGPILGCELEAVVGLLPTWRSSLDIWGLREISVAADRL